MTGFRLFLTGRAQLDRLIERRSDARATTTGPSPPRSARRLTRAGDARFGPRAVRRSMRSMAARPSDRTPAPTAASKAALRAHLHATAKLPVAPRATADRVRASLILCPDR
jgi:hypothetical protein